MINNINSWADLEADVEDLFNNPNSITAKRFTQAYFPLKKVINSIKENIEEYLNNPKEFSKFILQNPSHKDNLFDWLPYLSGDRAKLMDMKFFDKNDTEILDKSLITKMLNENDPAQNETYIYIFLNKGRVEELNKGSKLLNEQANTNENIVYADINRPGLNCKKISKSMKK